MRLAGLVSALLLGLLLTQTFVASEETPAGARTLRPGDNLIGWVGYPTTTEAFFEQLAEAELIYTWDAQLSRYQFAARAFEANLSMIEPGMGLIVRISGEEPVIWDQPTAADGERLTLEAGPNLVAWTGPSGTPLDLAVRSIGQSLTQALYWIPETKEFGIFKPDAKPTGEVQPKLRRGDALWVFSKNVSTWLQPSGDRALHPLGPPPDHIRWYRSFDKYLDADGLAIISTENVADEALFRAAAIADEMLVNRPDIRDTLVRQRVHIVVVGQSEETYDLALFRRFRGVLKLEPWGTAGPRGFGPTEYTPTLFPEENLLCLDNDSYPSYDVAVHEFAHAIDFALSRTPRGGGFRSSLAAAYRSGIDSGVWESAYSSRNSAEFWATGLQIWLGVRGHRSDGFTHREDLIQQAPQLAQLIDDTLGEIVLDSTCRFADATNRGATRKHLLRGTLVDATGATLDNARVYLRNAWGRVSGGRAIIWPDGRFNILALPGDYTLDFQIGACAFHYGDSGLTTNRQSARTFLVSAEDLDIDIHLPHDFCNVLAEGRVVTSSGKPLQGLPVIVHGTLDVHIAYTEQDGSFEFRFPDDGPHYFRVTFRRCNYLFNGSRLLSGHEEYALVNYEIEPESDLELRLPDRACTGEIRGRVIDENGNSETRAFVGPYIPWHWSLPQVRSDGSFVVPVDTPSQYVLTVSVNGCIAYYGANGLTRDRTQATPLEVDAHDLRELEIEFPRRLCDS